MSLVFDTKVHKLQLPAAGRNLDISNNGALLAVALTNQLHCTSIQVYDLNQAALINEFGLDAFQGRGVAFAEESSALYYLLEVDAGTVQLYRVALDQGSPERLAEYGIAEGCRSLTRDHSGGRVAVLGNSIETWDTKRGEVVSHLQGVDPGQQIHAAFVGDEPRLYAYGTSEGAVTQFDLIQRKELTRWPAPKSFGRQIVLSPQRGYLVAVGEGVRGCFVYDTNLGERVMEEDYNEDSLNGLFAVSCDESLLINFARGGVEGERLPGGEWIPGPDFPHSRALAIASARQAPIAAFTQENGALFWMRLIDENA